MTIDQLGDNPTARDTATARADDLFRAIRDDERVKVLAHNPLLLSILAMVHQRGVGLPQRRAELYDECTDRLLGYWDQTKGGEAARELATAGALTRSEKRARLEPVARFHERGEQGLEADKEELEREIARQLIETFGDDERKARSRAALFLQVINERAGLLVERETGVYAFAHLTFQGLSRSDYWRSSPPVSFDFAQDRPLPQGEKGLVVKSREHGTSQPTLIRQCCR